MIIFILVIEVKNKFLIIISIIIIVLVGLIILLSEDEEKYLSEITYNELVEKINNEEDFILYIKQTNCGHCQNFTPNLQKVLTNYKIKAFYLNLTNLEQENKKDFYELIPVDGTPVVYFYEKGEQLPTKIDGYKEKSVIIRKLKNLGYIEE